MKKTVKTYLTLDALLNAGADVVCSVVNGNPVQINENGKHVPVRLGQSTKSAPGFYFMVEPGEKTAGRFYIGRQRTKIGLDAVLSHIRTGRSRMARQMANDFRVYDLLFIPVGSMKKLTTAYGKGSVRSMFTSEHNEAFQNLEEMNRMLNDHFKFTMQKY